MPADNQTSGEFFAIVSTGRKGVEEMFAKMGGEMQSIAAPNVQKNFDTWSQRAIVEMTSREELAPVLACKTGVFSVYKILAKAATMGLQIGGQYPQAYLVPKKKNGNSEAILVPTAEGLAFISAHGPGAVLTSIPELVRVYEQDEFRLDKAAATVKHVPANPFGDAGKLAGYYMILHYTDGHTEVQTIARKKVESISEAYSTKTFPSGDAPAWKKSPEEMFDKIAAKQLLKKPSKESEGLAMLMSLDDYDAQEYTPPAEDPPMRDVTERASKILDKATPTGNGRDPDPTPEPKSAPAPEPKQDEKKPEEPKLLF